MTVQSLSSCQGRPVCALDGNMAELTDISHGVCSFQASLLLFPLPFHLLLNLCILMHSLL